MSCGRVEVVIWGLGVLRMGVARRHSTTPELGFISLNQFVLYGSYVLHLSAESERSQVNVKIYV